MTTDHLKAHQFKKGGKSAARGFGPGIKQAMTREKEAPVIGMKVPIVAMKIAVVPKQSPATKAGP